MRFAYPLLAVLLLALAACATPRPGTPALAEDATVPRRDGYVLNVSRGPVIPFLPDDFRRDAVGHRVVATVHMEAEREIADEVGETRWLAGLRKEHGLPTVAVGHARFEAPDVGEVLAGHAAFDFVRGIRQKPAAAARPDAARRGAPGSMDDPA